MTFNLQHFLIDIPHQCAVVGVFRVDPRENLADDIEGVIFPQDGIRGIAAGILQHVKETGVEGAEGDAGICLVRQTVEPLFHFLRGHARESDDKDFLGRYKMFLNQIFDPVGDDIGLPGAGPGKNKHRAVLVSDGLRLGRIRLLIHVGPP